MTRRGEAVLSAFDQLPREEREEVVVELLRRLALQDHDAPTDDDLTAAADVLFAALDREENASR